MTAATPLTQIDDLVSYHRWIWRSGHGDQAELRDDEVVAVARAHAKWSWLRLSTVTDENGTSRTRAERTRRR